MGSQLAMIILLLFCLKTAIAQDFVKKDSSLFKPQSKKITLFQNAKGAKLIAFKTSLAVNTDGIPISYHPYDLHGDSIALNSILNGIFVYRGDVNLSVPRPKGKYSQSERNSMASEAYSVIEKWRDSKFEIVPAGYKIIWKNVLIDSGGKPCVFSKGKYRGYFASATSLTNQLSSNLGECSCNNQVDPFTIPTIVLAKNGKTTINPVRAYGGTLGDLVLAYNTTTGNLVYGVIGDIGPEDNLGEGSVIMNMKLKGVTTYPKKKADSYKLGTDKNTMICVLPGTKNYAMARPYTAENIKSRITKWCFENGFKKESEIIDFLKKS